LQIKKRSHKKKPLKKTLKRKEKKVNEKKSFHDFTLVKVSFIGPFEKFSVTHDLMASKLCLTSWKVL
jgi:hypothetical protein